MSDVKHYRIWNKVRKQYLAYHEIDGMCVKYEEAPEGHLFNHLCDVYDALEELSVIEDIKNLEEFEKMFEVHKVIMKGVRQPLQFDNFELRKALVALQTEYNLTGLKHVLSRIDRKISTEGIWYTGNGPFVSSAMRADGGNTPGKVLEHLVRFPWALVVIAKTYEPCQAIGQLFKGQNNAFIPLRSLTYGSFEPYIVSVMLFQDIDKANLTSLLVSSVDVSTTLINTAPILSKAKNPAVKHAIAVIQDLTLNLNPI